MEFPSKARQDRVLKDGKPEQRKDSEEKSQPLWIWGRWFRKSSEGLNSSKSSSGTTKAA